ncbi:MAG: hypothetical protein ETSY2_00335 [Candidatus Entotheonella gemina]|uniref:ABC transporter domain-containing protein n=1 Tax=Candidatus Entotheonella gemina TaxID=1429439 RepID=W4MGL6_9BACT|nr:MAG: hypothetical protein ETSY2_00335 [Candidatus Entotheonella gemina]
MTEPLIVCRDVCLGYGLTQVLGDVNWSIWPGDFVGLVGPNGAGKTTLLRCLLGTLTPQRGTLHRAPPEPGPGLVFAYVPQEKSLDPFFPLSALDVVLMGRYRKLGPGVRPRAPDRQMARESLAHVGLETLAQAPFQSLSGGQKQRVLIARALAAEPHILILDEPTIGMDVAAEKQLMTLIQILYEARSLTIILATHNLNLISQYARQLAILGDGQLLVGDPDTLLTATQLQQLYQTDIRVQDIDGRRWIF